MNKGKEPVVQQRPNPSNPRIPLYLYLLTPSSGLAGDDSPTSKPKKIFKINSKAEVPSPKHSPLKNAEPFFPQALPQKISLSRQSNRIPIGLDSIIMIYRGTERRETATALDK